MTWLAVQIPLRTIYYVTSPTKFSNVSITIHADVPRIYLIDIVLVIYFCWSNFMQLCDDFFKFVFDLLSCAWTNWFVIKRWMKRLCTGRTCTIDWKNFALVALAVKICTPFCSNFKKLPFLKTVQSNESSKHFLIKHLSHLLCDCNRLC